MRQSIALAGRKSKQILGASCAATAVIAVSPLIACAAALNMMVGAFYMSGKMVAESVKTAEPAKKECVSESLGYYEEDGYWEV